MSQACIKSQWMVVKDDRACWGGFGICHRRVRGSLCIEGAGLLTAPNHAMLASHDRLAHGYGVEANKDSRNVSE